MTADGDGYVDLFWKGRLLVEHKSRGKDLDRAYAQAVDYFEGIAGATCPLRAGLRLRAVPPRRPRHQQRHEFALTELSKNIRLFGFIAGYEARTGSAQDPINLQAAERMGKLHDGSRRGLRRPRPRTCCWCGSSSACSLTTRASSSRQSFRDWIEPVTAPDGSDLGARLSQLFQVLNTRRISARKLDEDLAAFPYVNGKLFEERLSIPAFDSGMRDGSSTPRARLEPDQPGDLRLAVPVGDGPEGAAQSRRALHDGGEHPQGDRAAVPRRAEGGVRRGKGEREEAVRAPEEAARSLTFLDPACGCGNFLVVAYRELRELELEVLGAW